ncbi:putative receptor-like protein kinase [Forsythia ovata]|uniref:Receptor-like protein kinase n=1 Tax=Forsythia ovata TaxID=205694 RepID=A0ABD1WHL5_9LAMI
MKFDPADNYLIDCGSRKNTPVDNRVFLADNLNSSILSTPETIFVNASSDSPTSIYNSSLYITARILHGSSNYTFPIKKKGWHWIRLHFFSFFSEGFNLSSAKFSVSAQRFTLLKNFQPPNVPVVKEYSVNITTDNLLLTFTSSPGSFAFINGLEIVLLPGKVIPDGAPMINSQQPYQSLQAQALETVWRVNMGNEDVLPQNDTLSRYWQSDKEHLINSNLVEFVSNITAVNDTSGNSGLIAPLSVYGTATKLNSQLDPNAIINGTWSFVVDPGFDYVVRFHFCDILSHSPDSLIFNVFLNSGMAVRDLDLSNKTSNVLGAPYYVDVITRQNDIPNLSVSIGRSVVKNAYPNGILNGLEIMKISNSKGSLDLADAGIQTTKPASTTKVWLIVGLAVGSFLIFIVLAFVLIVMIRRSRRRDNAVHSGEDHSIIINQESFEDSKYPQTGYRFPLLAVKEATDNFSENLLIGIGGFGKVYKGVSRDNRKVAVKRGVCQSQQGHKDFRNEIEMLSQFRHRHLVSLIGYCDEKDEMIIIYEYMENGTLKNHLYGSNLPKLNWKQRLEICIGSARGLHYLHTGSAKAIIHRDVKSANILLDENMMAKVGDFGISKTGPEIDQTHVSTAVKGSFGYLDPDYLATRKLTEKSDVYSFGVVMLEVISGRPVIDPSLPRETVNLVEWALKWLRKGRLDKILDPHIVDEIEDESMQKFGETAEKCLAEHVADRPTVGDVLWNLENAHQILENHQRLKEKNEVSYNQVDQSLSTTQYSMGSLRDLENVSMSKLFSEMVKAEIS